MDAWRTSCPRLPVWEEANARGLITRIVRGGTPLVAITPAGRVLLSKRDALSAR
jgi:D-3-phosphoglycerate dehydrogenase